MNRFTCFFLLTCVVHVLLAQKPELVKDINPNGDADIEYLTPFSGKVFFAADDGPHGRELWTSDGTEEGTQIVKDIYQGSVNSNPQDLYVVENLLFFIARDDIHGYELWKSDGTEMGTSIVKDIFPGGASSGIDYMATFQGKLVFRANDGIHGLELWTSDGTEAGTMMIKDISAGSSSSSPRYFQELNGGLCFSASLPNQGEELWFSDGTSSGTVLLKEIYPGTQSSMHVGFGFVPMGEELFFTGWDPTYGRELWKTDGTTVGTVLVKDIATGTSHGQPDQLTMFQGKLYFTASGPSGKELYVTDGTTSGTLMVKDLYQGGGGCPGNFIEYDSLLYFSARTDGTGFELFRTDGTTQGTELFQEFNSGNSYGIPAPYRILPFEEYKGKLYFLAEDGTNGEELWVLDGKNDSTYKLVPNIAPNSDPLRLGSNFEGFAKANGMLFFSANYTTNGVELYKVEDTTVLSIDPQLLIQDYRIFPNPTSGGELTVQYSLLQPGKVDLHLFDLIGRSLHQQQLGTQAPGFHEEEIQLPAGLSPGIYRLRLQTNQGSRSLSLQVE